MKVEHLEVLVEEPSTEAALQVLLPKIIGETSFDIYPHQCKDDLLKCLPDRLKGYAKWLPDNSRILVVVDRDGDDCRELKTRLERMAAQAKLTTRSKAGSSTYKVVNRIVIEELEAWYFGDWTAVRTAYPRVAATITSQAGYRDPDLIRGGTWEAFQRVLQNAGYFKGGLRKIEAARTIAPHMDPRRNTSQSFKIFYGALLEMAPAAASAMPEKSAK